MSRDRNGSDRNGQTEKTRTSNTLKLLFYYCHDDILSLSCELDVTVLQEYFS